MFSASVGCVAVAGSRQLPRGRGGSFVVAEVVRSFFVRGTGLRVSVGCCVGVDEAVLSACPRPFQLNIQAIFNASGAGAWSGSAVSAVQEAHQNGASVVWGSADGDLRCKLSSRTRAVVCAADIGLLAFYFKSASRGTSLAVNTAVSRGLPVLAVCAPDVVPPVPRGAYVWFPCVLSGLNPALLYGWSCYSLQNKQLFLL